MDATLYEVRAAAAARVKLALVENTNFTKSADGGYSNSTAKTLITETNNVLAAQYCEHTNDGMTGLGEEVTNTLNSHKSNIAITKREVLNQSKTEAEQASTADITVAPQITTNSDAQDEAGIQNTARLAAIGTKDGVAAALTEIVGEHITNPVLKTADGNHNKIVDDWTVHQLFEAIRGGAQRPSATSIREQYNAVTGTTFNWKNTVAVNMDKLKVEIANITGFGVKVNDDIKAIILLANVEWAAQQTWGLEIGVAQREINTTYSHDHIHDATSIKNILKMLAKADEARDRMKAQAPTGFAQAVHHLQGLTQGTYEDSDASESGYAAYESEEETTRRGRTRSTSRKPRTRSPSPSMSRSPTPPPGSRYRSRSPTPPPAGRSSSRYKKRHEPKAFNATNCKHCKKYGGNGYAHDPPKSISHDDCFFNKKHKGWRPRPVCKMMDIAYRHGESFQRDE